MTEPFDWEADPSAEAYVDLDSGSWQLPEEAWLETGYVEIPAADYETEPAYEEPVSYETTAQAEAWVPVEQTVDAESAYTVEAESAYTVEADGFAYVDTASIDVGGTDACVCVDVGVPTEAVEWVAESEPMSDPYGAIDVAPIANDPAWSVDQTWAPIVLEPVEEPVAAEDGYGDIAFEPIIPETTSESNSITIGGTDLYGTVPLPSTGQDIVTIGGTDLYGTVPLPSTGQDIVTIGGTDLYGTVPLPSTGQDIVTIGGTDLYGTVPLPSTGQEGSTFVVGGTDFPFTDGPSLGDAYLALVQAGDQARQRTQAQLNEMMTDSLQNPGLYSPMSISTLFNMQTRLDDSLRLQLLPSYQSERDLGLVYSLSEYQDRHNLSFMPGL